MSLAQKETSEEVMNWLLDNEALEFTPEYDDYENDNAIVIEMSFESRRDLNNF